MHLQGSFCPPRLLHSWPEQPRVNKPSNEMQVAKEYLSEPAWLRLRSLPPVLWLLFLPLTAVSVVLALSRLRSQLKVQQT